MRAEETGSSDDFLENRCVTQEGSVFIEDPLQVEAGADILPVCSNGTFY